MMFFVTQRYIRLVLSGLLLGCIFMVAWSSVAQAQFAEEINYQGKLNDSAGDPVSDADYEMHFGLYTAASGGSPLWEEVVTVTVTDGLFSHMLGSSSTLSSIDFDQTLYLGVAIETDSEMTPRKLLGAVPAAFEAGNTQTFDNLATTSFLRSDQADTATGLLTFSGGLVSSASSTLVNLTTVTATTTNFIINNELFNDLTGTGLVNTSGTLSIATSTLGLGDGTFLSLSDTPGSFTANAIPYMTASALATSSSFTFDGSQLTLGGTGLSLTGSTANIALGSNYLSGDGDDEGIFVDTSGNIGIGTSSPTARLTVAGDIYATGDVDLASTSAYQIAGVDIARVYASQFFDFSNLYLGSEAPNSSSTQAYANVAVGRQALTNNETGFNNVAVGDRALRDNVEGRSNTAVGTQALQMVLGDYNAALGNLAGQSLVSGEGNVFIGQQAGQDIATTSSSVLIGSEIASNNAGTFAADDLVVIGLRAGYNLDTGANNNILIGYRAADSLTTGANNLIIGYNIEAPSNTADGQLNIGNIIFGTSIDEVGTTVSDGNIGIGTTSPASKLDVWGDFRVGASSTPSLFADVATNGVGINTDSVLDQLGGAALTIGVPEDTQIAAVAANEVGLASFGNDSSYAVWRAKNNDVETFIGSDGSFSQGDFGTITDHPMIIYTNTTARLTVDNTGEIGIGDESPEFQLESVGSSGAGYFGISSTADGDGNIFSVNSSGNVGIGTSSPSSRFTVDGSVQFVSLTDGILITDAEGKLSTTSVGATDLADGDFGDFTVSSGVASLDTDVVGDDEIDYNTVRLGDFNNDVGFIADITGQSFVDLFDTPVGFANTQILYMTGSTVTSDTDFTFDGSQLTLGGTGLSLTGSTANIALGSNYLSGDGDDEGIFVDTSGNIGIGTSSPTARLSVAGSLRATDTVQFDSLTNGLLQADASGNVTAIATSSLGFSSQTLTLGSDNQVPFMNAGGTDLEYATNFTFDGTDLNLASTSAYQIAGVDIARVYASQFFDFSNLYFGSEAPNSSSTQAFANVAVGRQALTNNETGINNVAVGDRALRDNVEGNGNTALGALALETALDGANTAVGYNAGGSLVSGDDNVFIGQQAGQDIATTSSSVLIGSEIASNNAGTFAADHLVVIGLRAGNNLDTGANNNILIGYRAADSLTTGANNLVIGYNIEAPSNTADGQLNIGNIIFGTSINEVGTTVSDGGIAIGTTTGANARFTVQSQGTTDILNLFETDGTEVFTVLENGNVGVGTSTPSATLTVAGATGTVQFVAITGGTLETDALGNVTVSSDERLKDIEGSYDVGLIELLNLEPIAYRWNQESGYDTNTLYAGFSAQNVESVLPEAVGENSNGFKTLSTRPILAAVVTAIQELWQMVTGNQATIADLEARIEELESTLGVTPEPVVLPPEDQADDVTETPESNTATTTNSGVTSTSTTTTVVEQDVTVVDENTATSTEQGGTEPGLGDDDSLVTDTTTTTTSTSTQVTDGVAEDENSEDTPQEESIEDDTESVVSTDTPEFEEDSTE